MRAPRAFAVWTTKQLQAIDDRREWFERLHRIELAQMIAQAINDPARLDQEYDRAIADAATVHDEVDDMALVERGRAIMAAVNQGAVLHDAAPPATVSPAT
jgi:hypothetical protein